MSSQNIACKINLSEIFGVSMYFLSRMLQFLSFVVAKGHFKMIDVEQRHQFYTYHCDDKALRFPPPPVAPVLHPHSSHWLHL